RSLHRGGAHQCGRAESVYSQCQRAGCSGGYCAVGERRWLAELRTNRAILGGANAEVSFAGAQVDFVGLDQINMPVPRSLGGRGKVDVLLMVESQMTNSAPVNIK